MDKNFEYKDYLGEVKDVDTKSRIVTGYLSAFNNVDNHNDIIVEGAFRKTLAERKERILFLNQHSWQQPHGFFAELEEDQKGLRFVSNPMPNTSWSNDALELYARGIVKEHSIGFQAVKWDWDDEDEIRTIKEIKLYEGSNVTLGANPDTPFTGFKAMTMDDIVDMEGKILSTIRNGNLTDETFLRLEIALKQLRSEAIKKGRLMELNQPDEKSTDPGTERATQAIRNFLKTLK